MDRVKLTVAMRAERKRKIFIFDFLLGIGKRLISEIAKMSDAIMLQRGFAVAIENCARCGRDFEKLVPRKSCCLTLFFMCR